jgi:hypothetical protein
MSAKWERVRDVGAFLNEQGVKRTREHAFTKTILHWPYCAYCGLLLLKNEATRRAAAQKCVTYE